MYTVTADTTSQSTYKTIFTISSDAGEDTNLFLVQVDPDNEESGANIDNLLFRNVAAPSDMHEYSTTPHASDIYRVNTVTMYFNNSTLLEDTVNSIFSDITKIMGCAEALTVILDHTYTNNYTETFSEAVLFDFSNGV